VEWLSAYNPDTPTILLESFLNKPLNVYSIIEHVVFFISLGARADVVLPKLFSSRHFWSILPSTIEQVVTWFLQQFSHDPSSALDQLIFQVLIHANSPWEYPKPETGQWVSLAAQLVEVLIQYGAVPNQESVNRVANFFPRKIGQDNTNKLVLMLQGAIKKEQRRKEIILIED
jgi:hypothetical protein